MDPSKLQHLKEVCSKLAANIQEDTFKEDTKILLDCISELSPFMVQKLQPLLLSPFIPLIKRGDNKLSENTMICMMDTLLLVFNVSKIEIPNLFFNLYGTILFQIYEVNNGYLVKQISEEYKLSIINCLKSLFKSISWDAFPLIYAKENAEKFGPVINLCLQLAQNEKLRALRIASVELIMIVANIDDRSDQNDLEAQNLSADIFMFFIPGISSKLIKICLEDEKCGHKIIKTALIAFGRLLCLVMRDYDKQEMWGDLGDMQLFPIKKFENQKDINTYLDIKRTPKWFKEHDKKLQVFFLKLMHVSSNQNPKVRYELAVVCEELIKCCLNTLPMTAGAAVEILIALSEDECNETANKSKLLLEIVSEKLLEDSYCVRCLLDHLECNFEINITKMPRIFNGIDEREQITSLNLLIGYLKLFGEHKLKQLLFTATNLNKLIQSLLHIARLESSSVTTLEESGSQQIDVTPGLRTPWKVFKFQDKLLEKQLEIACQLLGMPGVIDIVIDYLLDIFLNNLEEKKEATLILNEILLVKSENSFIRTKQFLEIYLDPNNCELPLEVTKVVNLKQVHNNVIQLCLQIEGVGKMALAVGEDFQKFLLKILYIILEIAGSGIAILAASGLSALTNIALACGYKNVKELINKNSDYISFHIIRKLNYPIHNESIFNIITTLMKYSDSTVLPYISDIVDSVLLDSCDKYQHTNAKAYLRVFAVFIQCLRKWLNVKIIVPPMKTRVEKEKDIEDFKISNLDKPIEDFSDQNVMGKSSEEMYQEDLENTEEDIYPTIEEYKKPEPPPPVKITVSILNRALNFLPSKDSSCKIFVLEILNGGVEIISEWEDELLPIVHKIWSPLINRFKEFNVPLIVNLSFELLVKLACLSKDFIRSRTVKEVLPSIVNVLNKQAKESFLKDVGSAYRYTQGYKMQLAILPKLGRLYYDLDVGGNNVGLFIEAVEPYLSCKQPKALQTAAIDFYNFLKFFDRELASEQIEILATRKYSNNEFAKNIDLIRTVES